MEQPFGIYIHIPYCRTICAYCGFVHTPLSGPIPEAFIPALCREITSFEGPDSSQTVFLGGGTPSLLSGNDLDKVMDALYRRFRFSTPEISIEVNSDDVTPDKIKTWKSLGINRVSIGVQSFDTATLRFLGRRHDADTALRSVGLVRDQFENWAMDLIYGAPPAQTWAKTLAITRRLQPPHISTYALTYVPGTPIGDDPHNRCDDDQVLDLYQEAETVLADYDHYEISNFARPGFHCRHNLLYWHNEQHAGFGPGAFSLVGTTRAANPADLNTWLAHPGRKAEAIPLTKTELQVETLIQHLRLREGIDLHYYEKRFGEEVKKGFGAVIDLLMDRGLLCLREGRLCPTRQGFYLNDEIGLALVG